MATEGYAYTHVLRLSSWVAVGTPTLYQAGVHQRRPISTENQAKYTKAPHVYPVLLSARLNHKREFELTCSRSYVKQIQSIDAQRPLSLNQLIHRRYGRYTN